VKWQLFIRKVRGGRPYQLLVVVVVAAAAPSGGNCLVDVALWLLFEATPFALLLLEVGRGERHFAATASAERRALGPEGGAERGGTRRAWRAAVRFVDAQRAALHVLAVQQLNRLGRGLVAVELHEGKTAGPACFAVGRDLGIHNLPGRAENLHELVAGHVITEVSHEHLVRNSPDLLESGNRRAVAKSRRTLAERAWDANVRGDYAKDPDRSVKVCPLYWRRLLPLRQATVLVFALVHLAAAGDLEPRAEDAARLPGRVRRIVVHVLGNPAYEEPRRRWVFLTPPQTQRLWRTGFGAHWIVWTDGSIWPRHPQLGEEPSFLPTVGVADEEWRRRLASQAAPVYSHLYHGNSNSIGIEVAHSGRADDPFPPAQARSLAWLLGTLLEMSRGHLTTTDVYGHKDLDRRPAYVEAGCASPGCPVFADAEGRPYRRRVDPPEAMFAVLAREGLVISRQGREDDRELRRAEALGALRAQVSRRAAR